VGFLADDRLAGAARGRAGKEVPADRASVRGLAPESFAVGVDQRQ
jgi:hypothetical protein